MKLDRNELSLLKCGHANQRISALVLSFVVSVSLAGPVTPARAQDDETQQLQTAVKDFQTACTVCHGPEGKGDGPVASELNTPPPDLTQIAKRNGGAFPTREIYDRIEGLAMPSAHGTREMPVWGAVFLFEELGESVATEDAKVAEQKTRRRLEGLVDYLRSIQD